MKWRREYNLAISTIYAWRNSARVVHGGAMIVGKRFENIKNAVQKLIEDGHDPKNWSIPEMYKTTNELHIREKTPCWEETANLVSIDCCLNKLERYLRCWW